MYQSFRSKIPLNNAFLFEISYRETAEIACQSSFQAKFLIVLIVRENVEKLHEFQIHNQYFPSFVSD